MTSASRSLFVVGYVALAAACGGSQFSSSPSASNDGGAVSDGSGAVCAVAPSGTGDEGPFCAAESEIFNRCQPCEACQQTNLNNCVALGDSLSAAFRSAIVACAGSLGCGGFATYANDPCVVQRMAAATPTTAQQSAKVDYCTSCATTTLTTAACNHYFDPPSDGGTAGLGYIVLLANDATATSIASSCSSQCGAVVNYTCAVNQFCKTQAVDACGTGYCGK